MIVGDFNAVAERIDSAHWTNAKLIAEIEHYNGKFSRNWLLDLYKDGSYVDSFRHLHKDATWKYTCWDNVTDARKTTRFIAFLQYYWKSVGCFVLTINLPSSINALLLRKCFIFLVIKFWLNPHVVTFLVLQGLVSPLQHSLLLLLWTTVNGM